MSVETAVGRSDNVRNEVVDFLLLHFWNDLARTYHVFLFTVGSGLLIFYLGFGFCVHECDRSGVNLTSSLLRPPMVGAASLFIP